MLELDGLRGIAAMAVLALHFNQAASDCSGWHTYSIVEWGHYGVQLFFMLSGFVILASATRTADAKRFLLARAIRIYPAYWASLAFAYVLIAYSHYMPSRDVGRLYPIINITMLQQAFGVIHYVPAYWTLYVELQFYLLVAALMTLGRLKVLTHTLIAGVCIACIVGQGDKSIIEKVVYVVPLIKYAHLFLIGVVICLGRSLPNSVLILALSAIACQALSAGWLYAIIVALIGICLWLATKGSLKCLRHPVLIYLGLISYPLYLIHQPLGMVVVAWLYAKGIGVVSALCVAFILTVVIAHGIVVYVEGPSSRFLKSRFLQRPQSVVESTTA